MSNGVQKLIDKARSDRDFFRQLLVDPEGAASSFNLSDAEMRAITARGPDRLIGLGQVAGSILAAGCGSSGTCESTCTATCSVTFTSIEAAEAIVNPA